MSNERAVVEINDDSNYLGSNLPVTRQDFEALADQRKMLQEFVSKQLRKDVDYGVIPGTKKATLYKPGAEKLARLFGLGVRNNLVSKEIDRRDNFAMFTYKAEAVHLKTDRMIAECDGSCNSQEKKYAQRAIYEKKNGKSTFAGNEATPICDILNTIQKMAQKRSFVGAVILATGASDFFNQDIDDPSDAKNLNLTDTVNTTKAEVPNVTAAKSADEGSAPTCCERTMMASKFHENQWYCVKCKTTKPM